MFCVCCDSAREEPVSSVTRTVCAVTTDRTESVSAPSVIRPPVPVLPAERRRGAGEGARRRMFSVDTCCSESQRCVACCAAGCRTSCVPRPLSSRAAGQRRRRLCACLRCEAEGVRVSAVSPLSVVSLSRCTPAAITADRAAPGCHICVVRL